MPVEQGRLSTYRSRYLTFLLLHSLPLYGWVYSINRLYFVNLRCLVTSTMSKPFRLYLLAISLALGCASTNAAEDEAPKQVQIIYGFSDVGSWEQEFSFALNQFLFSDPRLTFSPEYLRLNEMSDADSAVLAESALLRSGPVDLLVAVQPVASNFVRLWGERFAPDIPRLYVLPGGDTIDAVTSEGVDYMLLSAVQTAARETINVLPQLIPELEHLYIMAGVSSGDSSYLARIQEVVADMSSALEIHYLEGLTINELVAALNDVPVNSAAMFATYDMDRMGSVHSVSNVMPIIYERISIPVFGLFDTNLNTGVVGGSLTSSDLYAQRTAELILSILFDDSYSDIQSSPTSYIFDAEQLARWDIPHSRLPDGSEIINYTPTLLQQYWWQLLIGIVIIVIQLISIIAMMEALRRRNKAERERDHEIEGSAYQERLFESVISSITDSIFMADIDATIFSNNEAAKDSFGFSDLELQGMNLGELIQGISAEGEQVPLSVEGLDADVEPRLVLCKKQNGEEFTGEAIATKIINSDGGTMGYFALVRDISKRLSAEEERRQGQKMEALGNLVGGISHDFNNVLGVISGYTELELSVGRSSTSDKNLNKILNATDRAKELISQIMSFSRDNSSNQKPLDLKKLLLETIKLIEVSIPGSITLSNKTDAVEHKILGSSVQIQQIVMNLITNAYQSMKNTGGTIATELEHIVTHAEMHLSHNVLQPGVYSVLSISDSGPGMNQEVASKIFDPFFTTKDVGEGSGMGMTIVYNLLQSHHAGLDLQTFPGKGTRFKLYFKEFAGVKSERGQEQSLTITRGKGERILLVDDEKDLLESAQKLLVNIGYRVEAFSNPESALQKYLSMPESFDLLLSDENMPKLSGSELIKQARKVNPQLPAVIFTGYGQDFSQSNVDELNLSSIVRKPFTLVEISKALGDALS